MGGGWKKWLSVIAMIVACMILATGYYIFVYKAPDNQGAGNVNASSASSGLGSSGVALSVGTVDSTGINDWYNAPDYPYRPRARPISEAEAADQVRKFIHDDDASVTRKPEDPTVPSPYFYVMGYGESSFLVNNTTGEVVNAFFMDSSTEKNVTISADDARAIADAFAREHYYGFGSMKGMGHSSTQLPVKDSVEQQYWISYRQVIGDVQTLNDIEICIDANTSKVLIYNCRHMPTDVPLTYTVSKRDAVRYAVSRIGNITAEETSGDQEANWTYKLNASSWLSNNTNATVKNIKVERVVMFDHNLTQHAAWYIHLDTSWPVSIYDSRVIEDGFNYYIGVDGRSGEVISFGHCG